MPSPSDKLSPRVASLTAAENQLDTYNSDIAKLLLISRAIVLICWPAEEYAVNNGVSKQPSARSLLNGSLVRLAATEQLAQVNFGTLDSRGHRVLVLVKGKEVSIHDIMEDPWPAQGTSQTAFDAALAQALSAGCLKKMSMNKVAATLHKVEQAKYWVSLKQKHGDPLLPSRSKAAVQEQMAACCKCMYSPPGKEIVSMVQAGYEEEEPGEVSEGRKALRAFLHANTLARQKTTQASKPSPPSAALTAAAAKLASTPSPESQAKGPIIKWAEPAGPHAITPGEKPSPQAETPGVKNHSQAKGSKSASVGSDGKLARSTQPASHAASDLGSSKKRPKTQVQARTLAKPEAKKLGVVAAQQAAQPVARKTVPAPAATEQYAISDHPGKASHLLETHSNKHGQRSAKATADAASQQPSAPGKSDRAIPRQVVFEGKSALSDAQLVPVHAGVPGLSRPRSADQTGSIITSLTIAKLAPASAAQQAKQAEQAKQARLAKATLKVQPGSRQNNDSTLKAVTGKRKKADAEMVPAANTSSMAPALPLALSQTSSSGPTAPNFHTPSPNTSPDQPGSGKKRKIRWDPEAAAASELAFDIRLAAWRKVAEGTAVRPHEHVPSETPALHAAASGPATSGASPAGVNSKADCGSALRTHAQSSQSGVKLPGSLSSPADKPADVGEEKAHAGEEEAKLKSGQALEVVACSSKLSWRWGTGSAITGHFTALQTDMLTLAAGDANMGTGPAHVDALLADRTLRFSAIIHPDTAEQQCLANAACAALLLVECTATPYTSKSKTGLQVPVASGPECGSASISAQYDLNALRGLLDYGRLCGCLGGSNAALVADSKWNDSVKCSKSVQQAGLDNCKILLVKGSHLEQWVSPVQMSQKQQEVLKTCSEAHGNAIFLTILNTDAGALPLPKQAPVHSPSHPPAYSAAAQTSQHPSIALKRHQPVQAAAAAAPSTRGISMDSGPAQQDRTQSSLPATYTQKISQPGNVASSSSDGSVQVTILQSASKKGPPGPHGVSLQLACTEHVTHHHIASLRTEPVNIPGGGAHQASSPEDAMKQKRLTDSQQAPLAVMHDHAPETAEDEKHHAPTEAPAAAAAPQAAAQATSLTDMVGSQSIVSAARQHSSNTQGATQLDAQRQMGSIAAGQQSASVPTTSGLEQPVADNPEQIVGLEPLPLDGPDAELTKEKSELQTLQVPSSPIPCQNSTSPKAAGKQALNTASDPQAMLNKSPEAKPDSEQRHSDVSSAGLHSLPSKAELSIPPSRGKRTEGIHSQLDPLAAQLLSGKPAPVQSDVTGPIVVQMPSSEPMQIDPAAKARSQNPKAVAARQLGSVKDEAADEAAVEATPTAAFKPALQEITASKASVAVQIESDEAAAAKASVEGLTQSKQKLKRQYRQPEEDKQDKPDPKRVKSNPEQLKGRSQPAGEQPPQHQQAQSSRGLHPQSKVKEPVKYPAQHPPKQDDRMQNQYADLPSCTMDSIFRSISKLRLLGVPGKEQLSKDHLGRMNQLPPLVQLRVLSKYASEVMPHGSVLKFFQGIVALLGRKAQDTRWLRQRDETATTYRLCDAAASLYGRLGGCGLLPEGAVPKITPQVLPLELQVAYVLCLGGYLGSLPLDRFAMELLRALLAQVVMAVDKYSGNIEDKQTAKRCFELAGGKAPGSSPTKAAAPRTNRLSDSPPQHAQHGQRTDVPNAALCPSLDIETVSKAGLHCMVCLKRLKHDSLDQHSRNFLQRLPAVWQLRALSQFMLKHKAATNGSAFLTTVCKNNRNDLYEKKCSWLKQHKQQAGHTVPELHPHAQNLFSDAYQTGTIPRDWIRPSRFACLPADLHCAAACYAIGTRATDYSRSADSVVNPFLDFVKALVREADTTADLDHFAQSANRMPSQPASWAASQPPRDDKFNRGTDKQPAAAAQGGNPNLILLGPGDPNRHPTSCPVNPHTAPHHSQPGTSQPSRLPNQDPPHRPQSGANLRHCRFFFRVQGGCKNGNCPFYHGTHQEYVAHMAQTGLVPYGLKFVSNVGRDKWIVDGAVDTLNDLMLKKHLPRGSFSDYDLRPLAFLEDPHGEHSKLQLQVVQSMAKHGDTNNPVQLLQSVCSQVQAAQEEYAPPQQGYGGVAEVYGSRSMTAAPELPFSRAPTPMDEPPFANPPMFRGPPAFTPSPAGSAPLPLPVPFSQEPLPTEDPSNRDIPFPLLRYEEELLAGLLQLQQHQAGPVNSVEQLLAMQPQCVMPPDLAHHFQGDAHEKVFALLHGRPWLFHVSMHGVISVTRLAREGLVYKRDVITYLFNALTDGMASVSVAELGENVSQPAGITQVMMEGNGLAELLESPLFREDLTVHYNGPYGACVVLRTSGA